MQVRAEWMAGVPAMIQPYDEASNADNNIIFLNPGKYTVTYNASSGDITIVAQ